MAFWWEQTPILPNSLAQSSHFQKNRKSLNLEILSIVSEMRFWAILMCSWWWALLMCLSVRFVYNDNVFIAVSEHIKNKPWNYTSSKLPEFQTNATSFLKRIVLHDIDEYWSFWLLSVRCGPANIHIRMIHLYIYTRS